MAPLAGLLEELYRILTESSDYEGAWALKQTSSHFARVIEIPTLHSFQDHLEKFREISDSKKLEQAKATWLHALETLIKAECFPVTKATCRFCCRILGSHCFDEDQQNTRAEELDFGAIADMFCLKCGADNNLYNPGDLITSFSSPNLEQSYPGKWLGGELTLCFSCLRIIRFEGFVGKKDKWCGPCQFCKACEPCMLRSNAILNQGLVEHDPAQPCQHVQTLGTIPDRTRQQATVRGFAKFPQELLRHFCDSLDYPTAWALTQTCHLFYSSTSIVTLKGYFKHRSCSGQKQSEDLATLRDMGVIPLDAQPCIYCNRFRASRPDKYYHWKPLAYVDSDPNLSKEVEHFRWCRDCQSNHGSTKGCPYPQDIYTPCPDCMCCAECMDLAERVLELEAVPAEYRPRHPGHRPNGQQQSCSHCESALNREETMERLKLVGCEQYKSSPMWVMTQNILRRRANGELWKKQMKKRQKEEAEIVRKEVLRSGQWPEAVNRACFHPEVLHILFGTPLSPGKHVSGVA